MTGTRPQPRLDNDNRAFWTGGARGALMIHRCAQCGGYVHPPRPACRLCLSDRVAPTQVTGTGVVETFTVNHQAWHPGLSQPYVIARVALDDAPGVILTTNIVNSPVDAVDIGDAVRVVFEQQGEIWYPLFEKIA